MSILAHSKLSPDQHNQIDEFVKNSTISFDSSHNHQHAQAVYNNTIQILKQLTWDYEEDIITLSAKLHDLCDYKYKNTSISKQQLEDFITFMVGKDKCIRIIDIIDNISFTKEFSGKRNNNLPHPDSEYLIVISDADRLEAIGQVGLDRCIEFTRARGGQVPEDVIKHCHEKLLLLYTKYYIKTQPARQMAEPLHQIIVDYVNANTSKNQVAFI